MAVSSVETMFFLEKCLKEINAHLFKDLQVGAKMWKQLVKMNRHDVFYTTIGYYLCMKNECDKSHNRDKKEARDRGPHHAYIVRFH